MILSRCHWDDRFLTRECTPKVNGSPSSTSRLSLYVAATRTELESRMKVEIVRSVVVPSKGHGFVERRVEQHKAVRVFA